MQDGPSGKLQKFSKFWFGKPYKLNKYAICRFYKIANAWFLSLSRLNNFVFRSRQILTIKGGFYVLIKQSWLMEGFVIFKDLHKRIYHSEPLKKVFISSLLGAEIYHLIHVGHFYFLMALTNCLGVRGKNLIHKKWILYLRINCMIKQSRVEPLDN